MSRQKIVRAVAEYAREVLYEPLGIRGWEIRWMEEPSEEGTFATVLPTDQRRLARVYVCEGIEKEEPRIIHETLIHELLHLVHRDQSDVVRLAGTEAGMAKPAYDVLYECFRIQTELMVDHLASCFAELIRIDKKAMRAITEQGTERKKNGN